MNLPRASHSGAREHLFASYLFQSASIVFSQTSLHKLATWPLAVADQSRLAFGEHANELSDPGMKLAD